MTDDIYEPYAVDGAKLLHLVHDMLGRFVAYPSPAAHIAHTLWIAHAWLMDVWDSTPRIAFLSPEPGSGKSRALEITELLVPRPVIAVNTTPAYLFRKVSDPDGLPTILYDEIDTVFGPRTAKDNEDIRGLLNAGHRKGAVAGRCVTVGKIVKTEELPAYCAVALAGLNDLPDTLLTRSVVVRMRRRSPDEQVEPFRHRAIKPECDELRYQLSMWAEQVAGELGDTWPVMPAGITDRNADVWEALLAIADAAGADWPELAREAAVTLVTEAYAAPPISLGVRLLADLRDIFGDADAVTTAAILSALTSLDEAPWGDLRGKALDPRGLAARLRQYGVRSTTVRIGDEVAKGYLRTDLWDAWGRYLPNKEENVEGADKGSVTSVTTGTSVTPLCTVCDEPLDPVLAAAGETTHATCDPGELPLVDDDDLLP